MSRVLTSRNGEDKRQREGSASHLYKHTADVGIAGSQTDFSTQSTGDSDVSLPTTIVADPGLRSRLSLGLLEEEIDLDILNSLASFSIVLICLYSLCSLFPLKQLLFPISSFYFLWTQGLQVAKET